MHALSRRLAEVLLDLLLDQRHSALPADQDNRVDVAALDRFLLEHAIADLESAIHQIPGQRIELLSRQRNAQVQWLAFALLDEGQLDEHVGDQREVDLRGLGGIFDPLHRDRALDEIDLRLFSKCLEHEVDDPVVEVHPAQKGVAAGGEHLEHLVVHVQHRDVERPAAEVIDENLLREAAVEPVSQRRSSGLVDDALDVETGKHSRLLHRISLIVVVVSGNRDDCLSGLLAQKLVCDRFHLRKDEAGDLRQGVGAAGEIHGGLSLRTLYNFITEIVLQLLHYPRIELPADQPLGAIDGVPGIGHHLILGYPADQQVALWRESDHRGKDQIAAIGGDDLRNLVAHERDAGVRRAKVDTQDPRLVTHQAFTKEGRCSLTRQINLDLVQANRVATTTEMLA